MSFPNKTNHPNHPKIPARGVVCVLWPVVVCLWGFWSLFYFVVCSTINKLQVASAFSVSLSSCCAIKISSYLFPMVLEWFGVLASSHDHLGLLVAVYSLDLTLSKPQKPTRRSSW